MNPHDAKTLIGDLMREHGLLAQGWTQAFDNSVKRFGCCMHGPKRLSFSRHLVSINTEDRVRDTILHEIAHALAGPRQGHGPVWRAICVRIGAKPERCYSEHNTETLPPRWIGTCPGCGATRKRERLTDAAKNRLSCGGCSGGRFNPRFRFMWRANNALDMASVRR